MKRLSLTMLMVLGLTAGALVSCGGNSGSQDAASGSESPADSGSLSLAMSDAASDSYQAVYVTVESVWVHKHTDADADWQQVATPGITYDLLELMNGVREELGLASLEAGHYDQMRLIVGASADSGINIQSKSHPFANYVIDDTGAVHELKVPSGMQSGIKIVHGFDISANQTTELILDFDASDSVVVAGKSGQYLLKPVIRILDTVEAAIVAGTVRQEGSGAPIAGVTVSAQVTDPSASAADEVRVAAATLTETDGSYSLLVQAGAYTIVASEEGFNTAFTPIALAAGESATLDFTLSAAATGTLTGTVSVADADAETHATLSIRQAVALPDGTNAVIEVRSLQIASGGAYAITLPAGDYQVVSSSAEQTTRVDSVSIEAGAVSTLDIDIVALPTL